MRRALFKSSSSAIRMAKLRIKMKKDETKYADYLENKRKQSKKRRQQKTQSLTPSQRNLQREYERERKRQQRAKAKLKSKNNNNISPDKEISPYGNKQSLGKAVRRAEMALPSSEEKKHFVIKEVLKRSDTLNSINLTGVQVRKQRSDTVDMDTIQDVQDFYEMDDVSYVLTGKRQVLRIKTEDGKVDKQKRILLMNISEAHELFKQDNPDVEIGLTKFAELRPQHVLTMTERDQTNCLCRYHENIELILTGLRKELQTLPRQSSDLLRLTLCPSANTQCIDRLCENCGVHLLDEIFSPDLVSREVTYAKWVNSTEGKSKVTKTVIKTNINSAKQDLYCQLQSFARHQYNAKRQQVEMRVQKQRLQDGEILIHEDFSENYAIRQQGEIQQAFWGYDQITVFTAIVYFNNNGITNHIPYTIVSDELCHDKRAVFAFNKAMLKDLEQKLPWKITMVHYWSDGAGSQFKNKYGFVNTLYHQCDYGFPADWSYFETSHGKGAVDGIGGTTKRMVWRSVLKGNDVIKSPIEFFEVATKLASNISVLFVSKENVITDTCHLGERWGDCKTVPGTHMLHYVTHGTKPGAILCAKNTPCNEGSNMKELLISPLHAEEFSYIAPEQQSGISYSVGDFVLIRYESSRRTKHVNVAQILVLAEDFEDMQVNILRAKNAVKNMFAEPNEVEERWVEYDQVLRKITIPTLDPSNGHFMFKESQPVTE